MARKKTQEEKDEVSRRMKAWHAARREAKAAQDAEPGTAAHVAADPVAAAVLPAHYTNEAVAKRNKYALPPVVTLTKDELDKKLQSTYNPFEEAAAPYIAANPDKRFAWQSPRVQRVQGRREQEPVYDENGKHVEMAGYHLYFDSRQVADAKMARSMKKAADQAAAPELSYREVQEALAGSKNNNIGMAPLRDGEIVKGRGAIYGVGGEVTEAQGAVVIGVKTTVGAG